MGQDETSTGRGFFFVARLLRCGVTPRSRKNTRARSGQLFCKAFALLALCWFAPALTAAEAPNSKAGIVPQLVFGSFTDPSNAAAYAREVSVELAQKLKPDLMPKKVNGVAIALAVVAVTPRAPQTDSVGPTLHRVVSNVNASVPFSALREAAQAASLEFWERSVAIQPGVTLSSLRHPLASARDDAK